ncbi:MAG: iron uptake porin [Scytolyngbya sp. HA4215-MV1]|nr:iron uptake porin [Scytolyngbya sp. HA4215-MV1]
MSKILWNSLLLSPAILGAVLAGSASATTVAAQAASTQASQPQAVQVQAPVSPSAGVLVAPTASQEVAPEFSTAAQAQPSTLVAQTATQATAAPAAPASVEAAPAAESNTDSLSQINRYSREGRVSNNSIGQVTSVSQLSDVQPTDWAFQALQSLVERYGCIAGYPDGTYKGNRAMTRYEFAAGLNACLDRVNELIAAGTTGLATKEDLATLQKLQEEFAAELATLRGRVDALEARTTELEKNQFSTTTKLAGEVIFAVTDEFGQPTNNETVFQDRVRLAFNTSFSGKDLLVTRLDAGNANTFTLQGGGTEGFQTFNFGNTGGNDIKLGWLAYYFPIGDNLQIYIPAYAGLHYDYAPTASSFLENFDGGNGALSYFGQRNPIYAIGGGTGIGATYKFGNFLSFSAGYLADNSDLGGFGGANVPADKGGLFDGSYAALGQVTLGSGEPFQVALTYINAYRQGAIFDTGFGGLPAPGTTFANYLFTASPTEVNAFGASGTLKLGKKLAINGFFSFLDVDERVGNFKNGEVWTYGVSLGLADFGMKGSLLGLVAGVEPYLGNPNEVQVAADNSVPLHFEAFYKFKMNEYISITPGVIYIINPGQDNNNDDAFIGTLRTTFTF